MKRLTAGLLGACGILGVSAVLLPFPNSIISSLLGCAMMMIALSDAHNFTIPDYLSLTAIPIGLIASGKILSPGVGELVDLYHLVGALVGFSLLWGLRAVYFLLRGREGLGLGDVKLAAAAGAWIGIQNLGLVLLVASLGALLAVTLAAWLTTSQLSREKPIPFGVFLAPAIWIVWLAKTLEIV